MTINQAGPGFCSELYERREYTHKIAVARPWLDIWQCSNKWQRERRVQTLWPRVRRPLSTLTRDITLVPLAKIGLIVSLLVKRRINGLNGRRNFIRSRIFRKSSNPRRRDDMQYESLSLSRNFKFVKFFEFRKLIRSFFKFRLLTFDLILLFTRILGCVFYIKNGRVQSHTRFQADRCRTKVKANASLEGWPRGSQSPLFSPRCRVLRLSALPIALRERGQRDLSS